MDDRLKFVKLARIREKVGDEKVTRLKGRSIPEPPSSVSMLLPPVSVVRLLNLRASMLKEVLAPSQASSFDGLLLPETPVPGQEDAEAPGLEDETGGRF